MLCARSCSPSPGPCSFTPKRSTPQRREPGQFAPGLYPPGADRRGRPPDRGRAQRQRPRSSDLGVPSDWPDSNHHHSAKGAVVSTTPRAPCRRHRWRLRRTAAPACSPARRRRHADRPAQPPPVPAAALPGGDGDPFARVISPVLRHLLRKPRTSTSSSEGDGLRPRAPGGRRPTLPGDSSEYPYDSLIVAAGAGQSYFGHDEFALVRRA